eukprot:14987916-Alexandrium_andersonii.AAC.1
MRLAALGAPRVSPLFRLPRQWPFCHGASILGPRCCCPGRVCSRLIGSSQGALARAPSVRLGAPPAGLFRRRSSQ